MELISSKMRKIWGFEFLEKSLKLRKSFKFIKEKLGGAILKWPPFCAGCTDFAQLFFLKLRNYKERKVKKFEHRIMIEKRTIVNRLFGVKLVYAVVKHMLLI